MKKPSLRIKIVGVFVLVYGALFILLLGWMIQHMENDFLEEIDEDLLRTATELEAVFRRGPEAIDSLRNALNSTGALISLPKHIWLRQSDSLIYDCSHVDFSGIFSASGQEPRYFTVQSGGEWYRFIQMRTGTLQIQAAELVSAMEHTIEESYILVLISIPIVILLSFGTGYYLVRRLLNPLDTIMTLARRISSENLNERIPRPYTEDEVDRVVETLNEMIERLELSFSQLEQFSANASHELRTPLTILKGELEVALQKERTPDEYRGILDSNLEEVKRIAHTVEHLFLLARIDNNSISLEREPVELDFLLEEIAREAEHLALGKDVRIETELASVPAVQGDAVMLVQLFLNLVENGIKYNRSRGSLRISLSAQRMGEADSEAGVRVDISDTGIGIPEQDLPMIFNRFYRVDKRMTREHGGAGLGLSIAQWIVRMHEGRIEVRSTPGVGSTFSVFLPGEKRRG
jgi:heavy metal sensor kinase